MISDSLTLFCHYVVFHALIRYGNQLQSENHYSHQILRHNCVPHCATHKHATLLREKEEKRKVQHK